MSAVVVPAAGVVGNAGVAGRLTIVIPALNAGAHIAACLRAVQDGPVLERIVVDGGSADATVERAREAGAQVVTAPRGRGIQLREGAARAAGDWLLFLHADTVLAPGWGEAAADFMQRGDNRQRAAAFRFALDGARPAARRLESVVAWRCRTFGLPYGDQGLLIARSFYDAIGGFRPLPLFEDVDIVRRIGRRRIEFLAVDAVTSAERYRKSGYVLRPARNLACLALYFAGVPPHVLARLYG